MSTVNLTLHQDERIKVFKNRRRRSSADQFSANVRGHISKAERYKSVSCQTPDFVCMYNFSLYM